MKHVLISVLIPGMITAEDIYDKGKKLILPKGLTLTDKAIMRLESYDIESIRIEDPIGIDVEDIDEQPVIKETPKVADVKEESNIISMIEGRLGATKQEEQPRVIPDVEIQEFSEPSHHEKIQNDPKFKSFKKGFSRNVTALKGQLNEIVERNSPINIDNMLEPTMALLSAEENNTFGVFDMLHNMRQFDDLTFTHSMNVALICNVFAKWLGMSPEEIKLATACGMLHDIGKLKIEDSIIKKPDKLTDSEYARIKLHPIEGYKILQHQNINEHIKNSALMHHEKCDGSGYPLKLPAEKIDYYAKLVAIADVYDAMTSARVYRGALCPFKVIEIFEQEGLYKYDVVLIMTFLENVINTYIDNRVQLSDGRIGVVKWIDKQNLSRPMVQLPDQTFVELAKHKDLKIERIL